jgi:hypothetical protein
VAVPVDGPTTSSLGVDPHSAYGIEGACLRGHRAVGWMPLYGCGRGRARGCGDGLGSLSAPRYVKPTHGTPDHYRNSSIRGARRQATCTIHSTRGAAQTAGRKRSNPVQSRARPCAPRTVVVTPVTVTVNGPSFAGWPLPLTRLWMVFHLGGLELRRACTVCVPAQVNHSSYANLALPVVPVLGLAAQVTLAACKMHSLGRPRSTLL